jgi:amino-acid N-acetyltransferase
MRPSRAAAPAAAAEAVATVRIEASDPVVLRSATSSDLGAVSGLLEESGLTTAGVAEHLDRFVIAEGEGRLVGVAGLEAHGREGVLRSVAVHSAFRGRGLGERLTGQVLEEAHGMGLRCLYLLTTTAESYFPRHGFRRIARDEASPEVQRSVEFREACPASAVAMVLDLETWKRERQPEEV